MHGGAGQPQAQLGVRVARRGGQRALPRVERVRDAPEPGQQHHPVGRGVGGARGGHPVEQGLGAAQRPAREVPAGRLAQERRRPPVLARDDQQRRHRGVVGRAVGEQHLGRPAGGRRPLGGQRGGRHRVAGERVPPAQLAACRDEQARVHRRPQPRRHDGFRPVRDLRQQRPRRVDAEHGGGPQHHGGVVVEVGQPLLDERGERRRHPRTALPHQLLDEQRQPVGGGDHELQPVGGQVGGVGGGQRRGLRRGEPLRPEHHSAREPAERGAPRPVVPGRDDQQQPRRGRGVGEVLDEGDGVGVRPVQVLQRQEAAALGAQRPEQPQHAFAEHDGRVGLVDAVGPVAVRGPGGQQPAQGGQERPQLLVSGRATPQVPGQRRRDRAVRTTARHRPAGEHRHARRAGPVDRGFEQSRLADARLPEHDHRGTGAPRPLVDGRTQRRQLGAPPDQPRYRSHSTCTAVGPRKPMIGLNVYAWSGTSRRLGSAAVSSSSTTRASSRASGAPRQ